jgi:hypothetical protein
MMARLLCIAIFLLLSPGVVDAATFVVQKAGSSDSNPCTATLPCLTIQRGVNVATAAGDVVQIAAGAYAEKIDLKSSGSATNGKITIRGHSGNGCPTTRNTGLSAIHGPAMRPDPSVTVNGFNVNASFIRIECFKLTASGIDVASARSNVDIVQNYFDGGPSGRRGRAIYMHPGGNKSSNWLVDNNYVTRIEFGFNVWCNSCTFSNNEIDRLLGTSVPADDNDYVRFWGDNITFRANYLHGTILSEVAANDPHTDCFQTFVLGGFGTEFVATNIVIDRNTCSHKHQGIIARDTTSSTLGSYSRYFNWTISNNVFIGSQGGYPDPWSLLLEHVGNVTTHGNTFFGPSPGTVGVAGYVGGTQAVHRNNIHINGGYLPYSSWINGHIEGQITACATNLLYEAGRTYGNGFCASDILNQDPKFLDPTNFNFRLTAGSPAINAGTTVNQSTDRAGLARPQGSAFAIGAYEFGKSSEGGR